MVNRILRDDPTKSDMHNRQGMSIKMIYEALIDWRLWPLYILGIVHLIPVGPPQTYLTLSLRNLGFNTTQTNLLTVPSTVLGMVLLPLICYFSEIVDSRFVATIVLQLWALPLLIALYTFDSNTSNGFISRWCRSSLDIHTPTLSRLPGPPGIRIVCEPGQYQRAFIICSCKLVESSMQTSTGQTTK
ncbi:hypothetical protein BD779DRAFT_68394 [Infundibulicybe gibba]|nr:hypothetical protein BD779DRAFT_68394 [Infundibulicybe gibba]